MLRRVLRLSLRFGIYLCAAQVLFSKQDSTSLSISAPSAANAYQSVNITGLSLATFEALEKARPTQDQYNRLMSVYTGDSVPDSGSRKPPVVGRYELLEGSLCFRPLFAFVRGMTYSVKLDLGMLARLTKSKLPESDISFLKSTFTLRRRIEEPTATVTAIFPSTNQIPENLLKFYIHFSAPMSRGNAYEQIMLLDENGREVRDVFLELEQELWDPATKRLTLFLDPARIKRGLRSHRELGPALLQGKKHTLQIGRQLRDADGNPLVRDFRKEFTVLEADRVSPNYKDWQIVTPKPHGFEPLTIRFDEALDEALLRRMLNIFTTAGEPIPGRVTISENETVWQFAPENAWVVGNYEILVDTALEDLAGNKLNRLFDVDTKVENRSGMEGVAVLGFTISENSVEK